MRNLGFAVKRVQALLGDPKGSWAAREYLVPLIDQAYGEVVLYVKNASGKELQAVVTVPNVPAGTTSLFPWQNPTAVPGQPAAGSSPDPLLQGLTDVETVFVKPAGQPPWYYSQMREIDTLPHVNPEISSTNSLGNFMYFTWSGSQLRITPLNQPLDIEVTGKFSPQPLVDDSDLLAAHEDIWVPTTFLAAALAGIERTNPGILAGYKAEADASQDDVVAEIMRQRQSTPSRWQRMARDSGLNQWYWS